MLKSPKFVAGGLTMLACFVLVVWKGTIDHDFLNLSYGVLGMIGIHTAAVSVQKSS